jgi:hypothetical protein
MKNNSLVRATAFGFICCSFLLCGCRKITDLTSDPKYASKIGVEYKILEDLVIMSNSDNSGGIIIQEFNVQGTPERNKLEKTFPYRYEGNTIYGVLSQGSVIKIKSVSKEETFESTYMTYKAIIISENQFKGQEVDVSLLTDSQEIPDIDSKYAVRLSSVTGR